MQQPFSPNDRLLTQVRVDTERPNGGPPIGRKKRRRQLFNEHQNEQNEQNQNPDPTGDNTGGVDTLEERFNAVDD